MYIDPIICVPQVHFPPNCKRWLPVLFWLPGLRLLKMIWRSRQVLFESVQILSKTILQSFGSNYNLTQIGDHHKYLVQYAGCACATLLISALYNAGTYRCHQLSSCHYRRQQTNDDICDCRLMARASVAMHSSLIEVPPLSVLIFTL